MRVLKQSTTPTIVFLLVDSTSHISGKTGVTPSIKLSKNGGAGAPATNASTAVDATNNPGWYALTLTATETNTIGDLILSATATGADPTDRLLVIEVADLTDIDNEIDAIKLKTDNLPASPAAVGSNMGTVTSVTDKTGYSLVSNPPTAVDILTQIETSSKLLKTNGVQSNVITTSGGKVDANASATVDPGAIDAALSASHGAGSWESSVAGTGSVAVNHNTGGTDNLRYMNGGVGIDNANIEAFMTTDYNNGIRNILAATMTKADGRWTTDLMLDPGFTYTIVFYKQGEFQTAIVEVTI